MPNMATCSAPCEWAEVDLSKHASYLGVDVDLHLAPLLQARLQRSGRLAVLHTVVSHPREYCG